ncbi:hypothetical protein [Jannaschia sp. CCS1]|uniref:hypothetical protein n=1 Tax=Jannaschia sp. (strain CCS1) TaxID=290400 RepID=UPI0002FADD5F|nr:hypothetical protein [Jannaschia sp. CCS1]
MNRRLDTRIDSVTRAAERIIATPTGDRTKTAKSARSKATAPRLSPPAAAKAKGVSMDYQMGFTSGPSV